MDSTPINRASSTTDQLAQLSQVSPVTRSIGDGLHTNSSATSKTGLTPTPLTRLEEQLFSLEQHIPLQILKSPQLMKTEWAWKLIVIQHISLGTQSSQEDILQPHVNLNSSLNVGAETVVRQLWSLLISSISQGSKGSSQVQMNMNTDQSIVPFAAMNQDTIALAASPTDANRLQQWVVQDRLMASVLDNPYERMGAGVFFPTTVVADKLPHTAVKWEAHRQTRIGAAGKLIHRIRLDVDVQGQSLTCIVTAQRPQLFVHFLSDDTKLVNHLKQGERVIAGPLSQCGWDLIGWTAGLSDKDEEGGGQS